MDIVFLFSIGKFSDFGGLKGLCRSIDEPFLLNFCLNIFKSLVWGAWIWLIELESDFWLGLDLLENFIENIYYIKYVKILHGGSLYCCDNQLRFFFWITFHIDIFLLVGIFVFKGFWWSLKDYWSWHEGFEAHILQDNHLS